jgi:hypothetical protein
MRDRRGWFRNALAEAGNIFEAIWQSLKDSGPCCGIRFDSKGYALCKSEPILSCCSKMRI